MFCDVQQILNSNKGIQVLECVFIEQVLKESFKLYRAINDGIINLVDKVGLVSYLALEFNTFPFIWEDCCCIYTKHSFES